jgi:UDP-2,4-diacetamido-2,4,6-trideoxy-beta-L-altropyranose hydrolase
MERIILFRADGGSAIGLGHFIRTLALAEMLKDNFHCVFVTKSPSEYQINEISKVCPQRIDLPDNETHFDIFLNQLKGNEIVVLDNYYFNTDYQKAIKTKGCILICIDDLHDKVFFADLIINHTPGIRAEDYTAQPYTLFALGLKYALIRQAFSKIRADDKKMEHVGTLFICFGGSDPRNLTESTLDVLLEYFPLNRIIVVIGDRYSNKTQLAKKAKSFSNVQLFKSVDAETMAKLMSESDLAIIPASGTLLEAMKTGLAVITGYYAPNQEIAAKHICESTLALSVGNMLDDYQNNLRKLLNSLSIQELNSMISRQKAYFSDNKETYIQLMQQLCQR